MSRYGPLFKRIDSQIEFEKSKGEEHSPIWYIHSCNGINKLKIMRIYNQQIQADQLIATKDIILFGFTDKPKKSLVYIINHLIDPDETDPRKEVKNKHAVLGNINDLKKYGYIKPFVYPRKVTNTKHIDNENYIEILRKTINKEVIKV